MPAPETPIKYLSYDDFDRMVDDYIKAETSKGGGRGKTGKKGRKLSAKARQAAREAGYIE